ncbi:MAG TPA: DUF3817 domain-containing protein [Cytophagaceae bacterium]|jgi:integral membrane protein|nr:DUF3817 domain-containing protein [Cytophagaceae bacterium]
MKTTLFTSFLGWLKIIGWLEGISFLLLLCIAMPLKYYAGKPEAVKHVGMAHGVLFIIYLLLVAVVSLKQKWPFKEIIISVIASFIPLGTFYAEKTIFSKK